jgi:hypothetical protein
VLNSLYLNISTEINSPINMTEYPIASNDSGSTQQSPGITHNKQQTSAHLPDSRTETPLSTESKFQGEPKEVTWDGDADPENPKNWPKWKKW